MLIPRFKHLGQAARLHLSPSRRMHFRYVPFLRNGLPSVKRYRLCALYLLGDLRGSECQSVYITRFLSILTIICHRVVWNDRCYGSPYLPFLSFLSQR